MMKPQSQYDLVISDFKVCGEYAARSIQRVNIPHREQQNPLQGKYSVTQVIFPQN